MLRRGSVAILLVICVLLSVGIILWYQHIGSSSQGPPNYEVTAEVLAVEDGDTIDLRILEVDDPHEGVEVGRDQVRFAGVDAEEMDQYRAAMKHEGVRGMSQSEYEDTIYYRKALSARELVRSLAPRGTRIYLDIDDLAEGHGPYYNPYRGDYDRLIAVVYVREGG